MNNQKSKKLISYEFIILEYLLKETSANDPKKYIDYIEYAKNKYNVYFDPRTVATTLESFYQLSKENADYFPFKIEAKGNKARKYYCEKIIFDEVETKNIIKSIKRNKELTKKTKAILIEMLLSILTPKEYRDKYIDYKSIIVTYKNEHPNLEKLRWFHVKQCRMMFKIVAPYDCRAYAYASLSKDTIYDGFVYSLFEVNDQAYAAILTSDHMIAMISPIEALVIVSQKDEEYDKTQRFDYYIGDNASESNNEDIDDFIYDFLRKNSYHNLGDLILLFHEYDTKSHDYIELTVVDDDYHISKVLKVLAKYYPGATFKKITKKEPHTIQDTYKNMREEFENKSNPVMERKYQTITLCKNTVSFGSDIDYFVEVYFRFAGMEHNPIVDIKPDYIKKVLLMKMEYEHNHISRQLGGK